MKELLLHIIIGCLGMVLLVGCSSPDERANKLFVEASQLVKAAQEAEKTSYSDALKLYKDAMAKLERITAEYPSSQVAVKIAQGDTKIGPYAVTEFKETILPLAKVKADAEESPFACALLVAKTIKDASYRAGALATIAGRYAEAGQKDKATEILSQALQVAETINTKTINTRNLSKKLGEYFQEKVGEGYSPAQASKTINTKTINIINRFIAQALVAIAGTYAEAGQKDKASGILSQALQVAETIEYADDKAEALAEIAVKYAQAGQKDEALVPLSQALQVAETIDYAYSKANALATIAGKYAEAGQKDKASGILSQALQVAETIERARSKANVLVDIAVKYAEAGQYGRALQVAETIDDASLKAKELAVINEAYAEASPERQAEIAKTIEAIKNASWKAEALATIAGKYAEARQYAQALQVAKTIGDAHLKSHALATIAVNYAKAGQKVDDSARKILHEIIRELE